MSPQPFCRCCGKPIAKNTITVWIKDRPRDDRYDRDSPMQRVINVEKLPQTIGDCSKLTNMTVVAVMRHKAKKWSHDNAEWEITDTGIDRFQEWDGESYKDRFFCSGTCARTFGYAAAESGLGSKVWREKTKETT